LLLASVGSAFCLPQLSRLIQALKAVANHK
jgi:hypothetical protein